MKNVLFVLFCFVLIGCNKGKQDKPKLSGEVERCIIDVDKVPEFQDLSDLFEEDIVITRLETTENSLVSDIIKVEHVGDFIYVSDQTAQCVFQFDRSGKFIKKIGYRGEGPTEYTAIGDFTANDKYLYIQDLYVNKILRYSIQNDSVVAFPLEAEIYIDEMIDFGNMLYGVSNYNNSQNGCFNLYRMNLSSKKMEALLSSDKKIAENNSAWGLNRFASKYADSAILTYPLNDTVYHVTKDRISPQYIIQFSNRTLPIEMRTKSAMEIMENSSKYILGIDNIRNLKDYIYFSYGDKGTQKNVMINKQTLDCQTADRFVFNKWGGLYVTTVETAGDEFVIWQPAYFFKRSWEAIYSKNKFKKKEDRQKFQNLYDQMKEDDNPVLFSLKFKE